MLSRTAENLYWTGRYLERAEFMARVLEAAMRLSSLPAKGQAEEQAWSGAIASSGAAESFYAQHRVANERNVRDFLALSRQSSSSIGSCVAQARFNARAVRASLTSEIWEGINAFWNGLSEFEGALGRRDAFVRFLEWVKQSTLVIHGALVRTMLRNDAAWFLQLGAAVERADNTARLLDVKYHLLLPPDEPVGGGLDYFQWTTLLREVSALNAYRTVYRDSVKPWLVADLLVLNRQMPRSLASCQSTILRNLEQLADTYGRWGVSQRLAATTMQKMEESTIDQIFQDGLHEYIQQFLRDNNRLSLAITEQYLV